MKTLKISGLLLVLISIGFLTSCKEKNVDENKPSTRSNLKRIIVERGAFHYDKFILEDSVITFIPTETGIIEEFPQYTTTSKTSISNTAVDSLFQYIEDAGFYDLNSTYSNQTSDNSMLRITVESGLKKKTVFSEDFDRGCPELLRYIEDEIVRLHGKNLKRQFLPG